jgi:hypothetical protein
MKLDSFIDSMDVIIHAIFHLHMMDILRVSGGQNRGFISEVHMALTTSPCATALASDDRYLTAQAPHILTRMVFGRNQKTW